jgi:WD40 repeat protein
VNLWDGQGRRLQQLTGPFQDISALALSADGARIAVAGGSGTIWLWDASSGQGRVLGQHSAVLHVLAFSPDGRHLVSGGRDGVLRIWNPGSGESRVLHTHRQDVTAVAFSPDGRFLASGSMDHTAWLQRLDPSSGQPVEGSPGKRLDMGALGILRLRFSPDGRELFVLSMGDFTVRRWDAETGAPLNGLAGHFNHVVHMSFSPEGQRLATASLDGTARVWDLRSGESRVLRADNTAALQVVFSRDGRYVVTAGQDGTVRAWREDLPLDALELRARLHQMTSY